MEAVIFAEVLDRRGHVLARTRVPELPFSIGRSYASDLILDDPLVSPAHAQLERDESGSLVLRDLGSTNGILRSRAREQRAAFDVHSDDIFHLGRTLLRFRTSVHAVPDALPAGGALLERLETRPALTLFGLPLVVGITIAQAYRSSYEPVEWLGLWRTSLAVALALAAWAGVWALVGRMLSQRAHLAAQWSIACASAVASHAIDAGMEWLQFLVPSLIGVNLCEFSLQVILASVVLHAHLSAAGALARPARRALAASAVSIALLSLVRLDDLVDGPNFVSALPYWSRLEPLDPRWLGPESVDSFFAGADALRTDVDELATKPPRP